MSYQSPIDIIFGETQTKLEGDVLKVIKNYDITVDKNELLKALNYDRDQYHKGWSDGWVHAKWDIIRCKDCKWYIPAKSILGFDMPTGHCNYHSIYPVKDDFCSKAERREDADSNTDTDDI